jgi:hypothetical protein
VIEKGFKRDDRRFRKANSQRAGYHVTQQLEGLPSSRTYHIIQLNNGQPEDCDTIQCWALEIMSVQLGQWLTRQILISSQRPCQKANARPYR